MALCTSNLPNTDIKLSTVEAINYKEEENQLFDFIPTSSNGVFKIIMSDYKYLTFNIENTKANYTFYLKPNTFDENKLKITMDHNLAYYEKLSNMIQTHIENTTNLEFIKKKIIETLIEKSVESQDYYISTGDQLSMSYKTFRYKYNETSNEKMYCSIYNITRDEYDTRESAVHIYNNGVPIYFSNIEDFYDYIKNKSISFEEVIYFDLFVDIHQNKFYYVPHIHSINFTKEPIMDNSVKSFNNYSKQEQQNIVDEMILNCFDTYDNNKCMQQAAFYFKPIYFKTEDIDMKDFGTYTMNNTKYKPSLWGGRSVNMENVKESFHIIADDNIVTFLENIKECLDKHKDKLKEKLVELKKIKKKEDIVIKLPITDHYEVTLQYDEQEEEEIPVIVDNGMHVKTLQIKQPHKSEETIWNEIPTRGLYYKLKNVSLYITKLFYYEAKKELRLQLSFSKFLKIEKENENNSSGPKFSDFYSRK